ncbi:YtjB family periplasmic protein [Avibacterium sp. 20-15]|uniref:YtjB family periplasmic protein n=1 Tax=unclassified Avibacterium TaxID=2685287 RepID=UPI002026581E|nr:MULTISPECIES: YtjB family periplasmic protein [unclassified Avibacterium]MCW9732860.1 YtjB family periplasmic protein [Avibacterium sp. 20-15]URL02088.1 YtjB family periplasmic protein [Avibacterium sp. 20-126]URL04999.1 YtjB family periplasmic protein [Avibacterium sp. 20-132]URL06573.1 YtjB family periplasmic protein [Avibacterium sp. 21-595]
MQLIKEKALKIAMIFIIILFCLGIMGVILFGVQQFKLGSQLASINQVTNLSHLLVRQQANLFSMLLLNNAKSEQLTENLDNFVKEDFILDASVYSQRGELLAQSSNASLLRLQLGLDQPVAKEIINQQIVEPIYSSEGVEGFLRVTFNNKYGQTTQSKINLIFNRLYGEIIIVFLTGVLFASSIHYFLSRYRRVKRKQLELSQPVKKPSSPTNRLTYHRKRRRFKNKA